MKPINKPLAWGAVLFGLMLGAGCGTVYEGGDSGGGVDVYGADEGPYNYGYVEYGGVGHVRPPFHADDGRGRVDNSHADHGRPAGGSAPARSGPPSIPNHSRPSGGGGGGRPSGGGGGHSGGGGGGGHPSSSGSGDHKH